MIKTEAALAFTTESQGQYYLFPRNLLFVKSGRFGCFYIMFETDVILVNRFSFVLGNKEN